MLSTMRLANTYNALGWRTTRAFDDARGAYDGLDQKRVYFYGADWRMLEERINTDVATDSDSIGGAADDTDWVSQQFWGLRHIDDAVGKRIDRTGAGDFVDNPDCTYWYQLTDTQFSVCAVLDGAGNVYERVSYDAYGRARHRFAADANGDGAVSSGDFAMNGGDNTIDLPGYHADLDVNCDGTYDVFDTGIIIGHTPPITAGLPAGWIGEPDSASGPDNSIGYAGYVFNHEREDYTVRFRNYNPELGRWMQRDSMSYIDSNNLILYVKSNPINYFDAMGLLSDPTSEINRMSYDMFRMAYRLASGFTMSNGSGSGGSSSKVTQGFAAVSNGTSLHAAWDAVRGIRSDAEDYSNNKYPDETMPGKNNAARHGYWQAMLTCKHGSDNAEKIGNAHEAGRGCQKDSRVDQYNNEVARGIGNKLKTEGKCDKESVQKAIDNAIQNGDFITDPNDPRVPPAPEGCDDC